MIISLSPYLSLPLHLLLTQFLSPFFMQDPKNNTRKRWYERAIEASTLWKALSKPIDFPINNSFSFSLWNWKKLKTISKTTQLNQTANSSKKLRKSRSTASSSFSHVCLCAPISSSFTDILAAPTPTPTPIPTPRRSLSYARSRSLPSSTRTPEMIMNGRMSVEGRKIFRGKSLRDDVLMRRFVVEEEEAMKKKAVIMRGRNNEMEIIRRRNNFMRMRRKNNIGPSPLSRMVLAN